MGLEGALDRPNVGDRRRFSRDDGALVGSACTACGQRSWPGRSICQRCGEAKLIDIVLAREGRLITFTTVRVPRPGLNSPYVLGQVCLADGVRVFGHVRGSASVTAGSEVRIVIGEDGDEPPFWFAATGSGTAGYETLD